MSGYLLDVNVLLALCDPRHEHHDKAHAWFSSRREARWLTCELTETAFVRIAANPKYPNSLPSPAAAREALASLANTPGFRYGEKPLSLRDRSIFPDLTKLACGQVTDVFLLGMAVVLEAKLATFDRRIPKDLVRGGAAALELLAPP